GGQRLVQMEHRVVAGVPGHEELVSEAANVKLKDDEQGDAGRWVRGGVAKVEFDLVIAVAAAEHQWPLEAVPQLTRSIDALKSNNPVLAFSHAEERLTDRGVE